MYGYGINRKYQKLSANISSDYRKKCIARNNRREMRLKVFGEKCENISYLILYFKKKVLLISLFFGENPRIKF